MSSNLPFRIPHSTLSLALASLAMAAATSAEPLRVTLTFDDSLKDHLLIAAPKSIPMSSPMNAQNIQTLLRQAPGGTELMLVENLNYDAESIVHIRRGARPTTVEMVSDHGQWIPVRFSYADGMLHIPCDLPCYEVKVFRLSPQTGA